MAGKEYRLTILMAGKDTGAKTMLSGLGSAFGSLGSIAGGILGAGLFIGLANQVKAFATEAISATANVQKMQMSLQTLQARELIKSGDFTDMNKALEAAAPLAKKTMDELMRIAIVSPYQVQNVQDTYRMAMAFGYTSTEATMFTKAILNMGAGVGAGSEQLDRMSYNLAQIRMVGKVTALDIRQLAMAGLDLNDVLKYVGKQMGVNIKDHLDFNKAIETGKITWADFTKYFAEYADVNFGGAAERMSRTLDGLKSTFKDVFALSMPAILGPAAEEVTSLLNDILTSFMGIRDSGALDVLGTNLAEKIKPGIDALRGFLEEVGIIVPQIDERYKEDIAKIDFGTAIKQRIDNIDMAGVGASITAFIVRIATDLKTKIEETDWAGTFGIIGTKFSEFLAGLTGQKGGAFSITEFLGIDSEQLLSIQNTLNPIIESISNFASVAMAALGPAFGVIGASLVAAWETMKPALTELWNTFVSLLPDGFNTLSEIIVPVVAIITGAISILTGLITGIVTGLSVAILGIITASQFVKDGLSDIFSGLSDIFTGFFTVLTGLFTNNLDTYKNGWEIAWGGIVQFTTGIFEVISGVIGSALLSIVGFFSGFVLGVIGYFENLYNTLVGHSIIPDMMSAILNSISSTLASALGVFSTWVTNVIAAITAWTTPIFNALKAFGLMFYQRAAAWVQQAARGITDMAGALLSAAGDLMADLEAIIHSFTIDINVNMPSIPGGSGGGGGGGRGGGGGSGNVPQMANGGIASGPLSGFRAILHGAEAVIPLKNGSVPVSLNAAGMGGGGMTLNFSFVYAPTVSTADRHEAADMIAPLIIDRIRQEFTKRNL